MMPAPIFNRKKIQKNLFLITVLIGWLMLASCAPSSEIITLEFAPTLKGKDINCSQSKGNEQLPWRLSQLQFYIHQVEFLSNDNQWLASQFSTADNATAEVALLGGICGQQQHWQVKLVSPLARKNIRGLRFTLGIPRSLNHLNPLTQASPLNQPDMFWTWRLGHKFIRLELASEKEHWVYHLGSTGCRSASPMRSPTTECKKPNRPVIEFDNYTAGQTISFELEQLLSGFELVAENSCQSDLENSVCQSLLQRSGIGGQQVIFMVRP